MCKALLNAVIYVNMVTQCVSKGTPAKKLK